MFTVEKTNKLSEVITSAFASDNSLINNWHIVSGSGLSSCVENTVNVLTNESHSDFEFFTITEEDKFVGYFGREANGSILSTFFIAPDYRSQKDSVWSEICSHMEPKFASGIYNKNRPCIKFYETKGNLIETLKMPNGQVSVYVFEGKE